MRFNVWILAHSRRLFLILLLFDYSWVFSSLSIVYSWGGAGIYGCLSSNLLVNRESKRCSFRLFYLTFFSVWVFHNLHLRFYLGLTFPVFHILLALVVTEFVFSRVYTRSFELSLGFLSCLLTGPGVFFLKQLLGKVFFFV
jgi:hypothetical protein